MKKEEKHKKVFQNLTIKRRRSKLENIFIPSISIHMTTIDTPSGSSPDFSGFNSFDTKNNPTLERAKNTLQKLAQLIIENN